MNIALIQLPHFYGDNLSRIAENYPLGLGYLSNVLNDNEIPHETIDLWGPQLDVKGALESTDFSRFSFVCISAYITQYKYLKQFSLALKDRYPDIPIICGGPGPTFSHEIILNHTGVDVCVHGEGEITLVDLLQNFSEPGSISGISFKSNGKIIVTSPREPIKDLDTLKFPNRGLFNYEALASESVAKRVRGADRLFTNPVKSAGILAGRGCPYSCHFCSKTFSGIRLRSVDNIIAEVEYLVNKCGVNHLQFNDELVFVNKKRSLELIGRLKAFGLKWSCQGRIDQVDRDLLVAARESGCIEIGYGVESVSQHILDNMNKRQKVEQIIPVIKMTAEVGIKPIVQYMYGYTGENDQTIADTIKFFKAIDHPFVGSPITPIPGTSLYADCLSKGLIGNEEEFILKLDSGYSMSGCIVNLTQFSDKELAANHRKLLIKITHNYMKKRPVEYLKFILGIAQRKLSRLILKIQHG